MNKYELAENLTKLANELFKERIKIFNIEEGFIDKPENVLFDKAARFEPEDGNEFDEVEASQLISEFIKFKEIPEMETLLIENMLDYRVTRRFLKDEEGIAETMYSEGIIGYESPEELEKRCITMKREQYLSQFSCYSILPKNRFPKDTNIYSVWIPDTVKYIYKIYIKYIPREANQMSDKEALAFRILVERKVG